MVVNEDVTLFEMFRTVPVRTALVSFVPVTMAFAQLVNGFVTAFPVPYALAFAAVMIGYATLLTRHHAVRFRLRRLEGPANP